ncbi:unnamed protein product [Phaedon cochleariae]|uniref:Chitin-binding type-2 domain-containing protein n=1 Tax=Phaedon cochleariae TaxID=80249 RepID=A0A9N9X0A6_PHACE|nr:unnamed protein product [Phaedon cochleariae]
MNIIFLPLICLGIVSVHALPEPSVTPTSGYTNDLRINGFGSTNRGFRPTTVASREEEEYIYDDEIDNEPEQSQDRAPTYANQNYPIQLKTTLQPNQNYPIPVRAAGNKIYPTNPPKFERRPQQHQQQQFVRRGEQIQEVNQLEEEKEIEEPDRLSLLLPQSKFHCNGKNTGYYADVELDCEVFHYCQENTKHSWICPEGFSFHQVHLICMPPGGENVCEKSTDYHFVNDYLYKPLNLEEHQRKPNITLVYSDRYYPEQYRSRYDEQEEDDRPVHHQHSVS